jgi:hypothetical protein
LQQLHQRSEGSVEEDDEEQNERDEDDEDEDQPPRNSRKRLGGPLPTKFGFYPPVYRDLLAKAKKRSRLEALDNPFPDRETFLADDVIEILAQLHGEFAADGRGVEQGYWEKHMYDMAIIVYLSFFLRTSWLILAIVMG